MKGCRWLRIAGTAVITAALGTTLWTATGFAEMAQSQAVVSDEPVDQTAPAAVKTPHVQDSRHTGRPDERDNDLAPNARSAVVMDFATGKVLYEKDPHERLPMASITKIMTMLLVMEAVESGRLKLTDRVKTSEYAASMGGSQIFLEPGETMTVDDLMKGIAIASANDACVAIAERLCGSEAAFVKRMNERARELGMADTHFVNCNGLPAEDHYSSAHDIAIMSRELLKHSMVTRWTSVYSDYLRKDTDHPLWLVNTNKLVRFYDGVDGLKTGYTAEAKYCLSATAKKNGMRVIAVVMGEPRANVRNREVTALLNWTFSHYQSRMLYNDGQRVTVAKVERGTPKTVDVCVAEPAGVVEHRGESAVVQTKLELFDLKAPVKQGQRVGTLNVYQDGELVAQVPLVAGTHSHRIGFWASMGRTARELLTFGSGD